LAIAACRCFTTNRNAGSNILETTNEIVLRPELARCGKLLEVRLPAAGRPHHHKAVGVILPDVLLMRGATGVGQVNAKRKGNRAEYRSMAILEAAGYRCSRSAASLGVFDVIGIGPTDVVLVQVKTRDWPGRAEMERLNLFPAPANCRKLLHRYIDGKRLPDVRELAS
jgi:hypothetical protein